MWKQKKYESRIGRVTVWPDLTKICHFGEILFIFGNILRAMREFGNILNLCWQIIYAFGQMLIVVNGQILNI